MSSKGLPNNVKMPSSDNEEELQLPLFESSNVFIVFDEVFDCYHLDKAARQYWCFESRVTTHKENNHNISHPFSDAMDGARGIAYERLESLIIVAHVNGMLKNPALAIDKNEECCYCHFGILVPC